MMMEKGNMVGVEVGKMVEKDEDKNLIKGGIDLREGIERKEKEERKVM